MKNDRQCEINHGFLLIIRNFLKIYLFSSNLSLCDTNSSKFRNIIPLSEEEKMLLNSIVTTNSSNSNSAPTEKYYDSVGQSFDSLSTLESKPEIFENGIKNISNETIEKVIK